MHIDLAGGITFTASTPDEKRKLVRLKKLFNQSEKPKYTFFKYETRVNEDGSWSLVIMALEND